jgi:hypothetical protein
MNVYRYYKLTHVDGGEWPASHPLPIGSIVRVNSRIKRAGLVGPVFNDETSEWVAPRWTECDNPITEATS